MNLREQKFCGFFGQWSTEKNKHQLHLSIAAISSYSIVFWLSLYKWIKTLLLRKLSLIIHSVAMKIKIYHKLFQA